MGLEHCLRTATSWAPLQRYRDRRCVICASRKSTKIQYFHEQRAQSHDVPVHHSFRQQCVANLLVGQPLDPDSSAEYNERSTGPQPSKIKCPRNAETDRHRADKEQTPKMKWRKQRRLFSQPFVATPIPSSIPSATRFRTQQLPAVAADVVT